MDYSVKDVHVLPLRHQCEQAGGGGRQSLSTTNLQSNIETLYESLFLKATVHFSALSRSWLPHQLVLEVGNPSARALYPPQYGNELCDRADVPAARHTLSQNGYTADDTNAAKTPNISQQKKKTQGLSCGSVAPRRTAITIQ